jgi:hypothetical protein
MLKLARRLFSFRPDAAYSDYHERALFNHVLASIDPTDGKTSYMVPVGRGVQQEYQNMQRDFTCCVGTGMENHALHGDGVFYESNDTVWVTLFVPATAQLALGKASIAMETGFPDGDSAKLTLSLPSPKAFTLAIRRPSWAGDGFTVKVNGENIPQPALASLKAGAAGGRNMGEDDRVLQPSSFVELERTWKNGDVVELTLPKALRLEPTPDDKTVTAIMWGPLVLAGDHGPRREGRASAVDAPTPVIVAGDRPLADWIVAAGQPGNYRVNQVARMPATPANVMDVSLAPFYRTHRRTYSTYFDVLTPAEFDARAAALAAERERVRRLDAATLANVQPGEMQPERDYNYRSEPNDRRVERTAGRGNRGGTGWFSFDLPVDSSTEMALVVTYYNELGLPATNGNFDVQVDGTTVAHFAPNQKATGFYDAQYAIPANLLTEKSKVVVRFQTLGNGRIAPVFGVRMVKAREL